MNITVQHLLLVAAGMLVTMENVMAADDKTVMTGAGSTSCGQYLEFKQEGEMFGNAYFSWAQGFMSAVNLNFLSEGNTTDLSDIAGQEKWLENYCNENPLETYSAAVVRLWNVLRSMQGLEPGIR